MASSPSQITLLFLWLNETVNDNWQMSLTPRHTMLFCFSLGLKSCSFQMALVQNLFGFISSLRFPFGFGDNSDVLSNLKSLLLSVVKIRSSRDVMI